MNIKMQQIHKSEGFLFYLLLLTGFFFLLEVSFFIQCNRGYLEDYTSVSDSLHIPVTIVPGIAYAILVQLSIHFLYCLLVWVNVELISYYLFVSSQKKIIAAISLWLLGLMTILAANQYFFPNSKFSELTSIFLINSTIAKYVFLCLLACCCALMLISFLGILKWLMHHRMLLILLFTAVIMLAGLTFRIDKPHPANIAATIARPNIILVGVDSLRPDFISYLGGKKATPFLDSFLQQASVFTQATTPLARTFPSWASLLTGRYPLENKIRSNLAKQDNLHLVNTLPAILKSHGYETIYATDETRFSNMDKNFGFERIITPPIGLNDFIIGSLNDFPLSNLLINTHIGKWLFPYSYANRPVIFAYEPDTFLQLLNPILSEQKNKPLFLAVHFCLPHFPYLWASLDGKELSLQDRYAASVQRVDKQLHDFFILIEQNHLLDHAIVVLLSDHGEALEFPGDRVTQANLFISSQYPKPSVPQFYPPSLDDEAINQSAGHGTDVLGLTQYHTLLAFRFYGEHTQQPAMISGRVSLLDIKPTLLDWIKLPAPESSGISLVNWIKDRKSFLEPRHIFIESDFSPMSIRTVYPDTRQVLLEGIGLFQINPMTTRLTLKPDMNERIIHSKQYADLYGEWVLALYPQNNKVRMPILINLSSGEWTNELGSTFAQHSPANSMLAQLYAFYGEEIGVISNIPQ